MFLFQALPEVAQTLSTLGDIRMKLKSLRRNYRHQSLYLLLATLLVLAAGGLLPVRSQQLSSSERERDRMILKIVKDDVKEHYYDPTFHGVNLDESFQAA